MTDAYLTLREPVTAQITRNKSRFIGHVFPVSSDAEIEVRLNRLKRAYHDASHHCHAYRLMSSSGPIVRTDDAGEPTGSAGRPILREIEATNLYDVLAVVVRYFGGTKLGIGGLIRAYSDATKAALAAGALVEKHQRIRLAIRFPPEVGGQVMGLIHRHPATVEEVSYNGEGRVLITLPPSLCERFAQDLREVTGAHARLTEDGQ